MDILLLIVGAAVSALFGALVLALALLWLQRCQSQLSDLYEQNQRCQERLHKATANLTYVESLNYEWGDELNRQKKENYKLLAEYDQLSRELSEMRPASAVRKPTRYSDGTQDVSKETS